MRSAAAFSNGVLADLPVSGEVNLLTTGALGPGTWSAADMPRGVAYFSLGAPTPAGDWLVRGAMSEGDLSSWIMAGSFVSRSDPVHTYEIGLTYSTQEYLGGNPAALVALKDGSRNVGEISGTDRWTVSPGLSIEYGARYARHDYLEHPGLLSPRLGMTLEPVKGTRVRAVLAQRMVAPGAEEFLSHSAAGPWLPPERTFAPLGQSAFRAERARYLDVLVEHEFEGTYVVGVRRFFQEVDDQLATVFGMSLDDGPRSVGHYYVANAGALNADGWGMRVSSPPGRRVRASLDYSMTRTRWVERGDTGDIARFAPAALRPDTEDIHDLTTALETDITETSTRVYVLYKLNSAFGRPEPGQPTGMDGRFDLQVNQALPFDVAGTRWEVLVGVRNLFRDVTDPASVYDELLVVKPPKRVVGGFLVRF
jgi:outer membrane receptor protein involved in Fe transport